MKRFPLRRTIWSNERVMAGLFIVLVLWQLPGWIAVPGRAVNFALLACAAIFVDFICNLARFRKIVCSVSAAVTAGVAAALVPDAPFAAVLFAVVISLAVFKHLWGGTGKNSFNIAIVAVAIMYLSAAILGRGPDTGSLRFGTGVPERSYLLVPAILLSLPFMVFRPFAALSFLAGTAMAFFMGTAFSGVGGAAGDATAASASGMFIASVFWSCIVLTDPVTVTRHPVVGALCGFFAGLVPAPFLPMAVLAVNAVSFFSDRFLSPLGFSRGIRLSGAVRIQSCAPAERLGVAVSGARLMPGEILGGIRDVGIEGLGGAGFPTYDKIGAFIASGAARKTFIVNAVECDPGLVHDKWLLGARGAEIVEGIGLVIKACGIGGALLAVKKHTAVPFALPENIRLVRVPDRYPAGAERILIRETCGADIQWNSIPAKEGFLVLNVQTVFAIREAVIGGRREGGAVRGKYLTVADLRRGSARVVYVENGMRIADVAAREYPSGGSVFFGGGLMQSARACDTDRVDRNTNFIAVAVSPRYKESPQCSRCGFCERACPSNLAVSKIADCVAAGKLDEARELGADRCLGCGSCSAVCLAGRNLSERVLLARDGNGR